jgi:hypothetical protein
MGEEIHHENPIEKTVKDLHAMREKDRRLITILLLGLTGILILCLAGYFLFARELKSIKKTQEGQYTEHQVTNQFLLSTIDYSTLKTKLTLYMRDQIIKEWARIQQPIDMDAAYRIAETNVKECENFPHIDPFIVLSMQKIESAFIKESISPMGALGMNQIMPGTGRLLCGYFGWEYSDSLLYDVNTSTHMAVKLIDVCWAQYHAWDLVLAAYNGGPYQAFYYEKDKSKLAAETSAYVPAVMAMVKEYTEGFKTYKIDNKLTSYNEGMLVRR